MFKNFIITTDSDCDLSMSECLKNNIIPMKGNYEVSNLRFYDTMEDVDSIAFYNRLRDGEKVSIDVNSVDEYIKFFNTINKYNMPIIHVAMSSKSSNAYNNALKASKKFDNVCVIDSMNQSLGLGMLVLKLAELRESYDYNYVISWVNDNKYRINGYTVTNNLDNMVKNGKLSISQLVANKIKSSILKINAYGNNVLYDVSKKNKKSIAKIANKILSENIDFSNDTLYVSHCDCENEAKKYGNYIKEVCGFKDVRYDYINTYNASNLGLGAISFYYFGKARNNENNSNNALAKKVIA